MSGPWCPVCCTDHTSERQCPGELEATGPERAGWRVTVKTERGLEAFGVLVAPCGDRWRARVLTFPNILWKAPGTRGTLKFVGGSAAEAVGHAVSFIRSHCHERGFVMRGASSLGLSGAGPGLPAGRVDGALSKPAPRKIRFLPVRFGVVRPSEPAGTGNLSETGLFVITNSPLDSGIPLQLLLRVRPDPLDLRGQVIWSTKDHHVGRPPGMGIVLATPPADYVNFVRALA